MNISRRAFTAGIAAMAAIKAIGKVNVIKEGLGSIPSFQLSNRRYIGCKQKLIDWIFEKIQEVAPEAKSLFDVFAGTGVVSEVALQKFDRVIINDLLYSNNVVYEAFFAKGTVDRQKLLSLIDEYNSLDEDSIKDNYFSKNFGGKYFESGLAKRIGFIRQDIEDRGSQLSQKERNILLASLIYSIDSHANTCGHFDAYIKKKIHKKDFVLGLVDYKSYKGAEIYREDSNQLARRIVADVAYIDPPYNSRQYSRFYHVYETLIKWDSPELFGTALKPEPENMSEYCRTGALGAFVDLIANLQCQYLVVSYNNTYSSKSKSSENKISLSELQEALESVGPTSVFTHKHAFFNTGKTEFDDHKEYLFVTKKTVEKKQYVRSPFFYVGDKYKLLPTIIPEFPRDIDTFVEPFVGGGSVFMNVKANHYLLNDIDKNMIQLHRHLVAQADRAEEWLGELEVLIDRYGLSYSYKRDLIPDELKKEYVKTYFARFNKDGFTRLRADYNASCRTDKDALDKLYLLLIYGFNRMLRYNSKGDFNLPVGNVDFNSNVAKALQDYFNCVKDRDIQFSAKSFDEFIPALKLTKKDFVYLDPPYLITESEYNKIWHQDDDDRLLALLDRLNGQHVRFAISNVTNYKGRVNENFLAWSRNYRVVDVKSNYINYHDNTNKASREVLVVNY